MIISLNNLSDELKNLIISNNFTPSNIVKEEIYNLTKSFVSSIPILFRFNVIKTEYNKNLKLSELKNSKNIDSIDHSLKIKKTVQERYGVENVFQLDNVKKKIKKTVQERYGVDNIMKLDSMRKMFSEKNSQKAFSKEVFDKLSSKEWWKENYTNSLIDISTKLNVSHSCVHVWANRLGIDVFIPFESQHERKIQELLESYNIEYIKHSRKIISPLELDIFIPSKNLAIEVNGVYWHSERSGGKDRNYHLNKTLKCEEKGIQLLQFWDSEMDLKWSIISSMILSRLGIFQKKIGARECIIEEVSKDQSEEFFNENHLQGSSVSTISNGLFYNYELVSCMSYIKSRYSKNDIWELARFSNKKNYSVPGGFSKLLKSFNQSCISYSDRRYSQGNVYRKNGFQLSNINSPGYHYIGKDGNLVNRLKYQKHKLNTLLETFDPLKTEWENMVLNGFDRVWDCGTVSWRLKIS